MPDRNASIAAGAEWARRVCAAIRAADCRWVVHVPDNPLAHVLRVLADDHPDIRTVVATREEEAFGIAAGLYLGGARSAVLLQSSGLGNSINALGSLLLAYRIPALLIMSMRGTPGEWNEAQVPVGRGVPAILDALGIQHTAADDVDRADRAVRLAASLAFGTRAPAACLLSRSLTATGGRAPEPPADRADAREAIVRDNPDVRQGHRPSAASPMTRQDGSRLVAARLGDEAVVATLGHPAYDLFAAGDRPLNFYTWGSMGLASSIGLGLALARPDRRVIVCDGDGSLLMNLGALATIGMVRPPNLTLIVWDNAVYGTTGGQRSATAVCADLAAAGRALGIAAASTVAAPADLTAALDRAATRSGPTMIVAKVAESGTAPKPPLDCVFLKQRFMAALGNPEAATQGGAV